MKVSKFSVEKIIQILLRCPYDMLCFIVREKNWRIVYHLLFFYRKFHPRLSLNRVFSDFRVTTSIVSRTPIVALFGKRFLSVMQTTYVTFK